MRAPELASGALSTALQEVWGISQASLILKPAMVALDHAERSIIMQEFAKARKHVHFYFDLKASFWLQLPWALCALAGHREAESRAVAQRCLELYDGASDTTRAHWLVASLCQPGTEGRAQLMAYANGILGLCALPLLEEWIAKMRFIAVVERWIEGRHAIAKRIFQAAPNASALHLGFSLAVRPIQELLESGKPNILETLGSHCQTMRTAGRALAKLGLWWHPVIQKMHAQLDGKRDLNRKGRGKIVEVIFHVDGETTHQQLPDVMAPPRSLCSAQAVPVAALVVQPAPVSGPLNSGGCIFQQLWCHHAAEFIRDAVFKTNAGTIVVSMGPRLSDVDAIFTPITDAMLGPGPVAASRVEEDFDFEVAHRPSASSESATKVRTGITFFTINRAKVEKLKLPALARKVFGTDVFHISVLPVLELAKPRVRIGLERGDGTALQEAQLFTPNLTSYDDLSTMRVWAYGDMHYGFGCVLPHELMSASQQLLQAIFKARRAHTGGEFVLHEKSKDGAHLLQAAQHFQKEGMLACTSQANSSSTWALTPLGETSLAVSLWLDHGKSERALAPRDGIAEADLTRFELLATLAAQGWSCAYPATHARRSTLAYREGEEKVIYVKPTQKSLQGFYLRALLNAARHKQPVLPFMSANYYAHIMLGQEWVGQPRREKVIKFSIEDEGPGGLDGEDHRDVTGCADPPAPTSESEGYSDQPSSVRIGRLFDDVGVDSDDSDGVCDDDPVLLFLPAEMPSQPRAGTGASSGSHSGPVRAGFRWRSAFHFTPTFTGGRHTGYQAACYYHDPHGRTCRISRNLQTHGGDDLTLRKLKAWCVFGASEETATLHKGFEFGSDPPDDATLDAIPLPPFAEAAEASEPAKKRRTA